MTTTIRTALTASARAMDDFLARALAAGVGAALAAGPLGCFVVWHRLAYFGETMAHAGLLGVALALAFEADVSIGVIVVAVAIAGLIVVLERLPGLATDTLLGILANGALAAGVIVIALFETVRIDVTSYLFGDVLAVSTRDLGWIWGGGALCLATVVGLWRPLIAMTVETDIARVEGVPVAWLRPVLVVLLAVVIAVAMKVVGILMIVSLLIVPAAAARQIAATPETMAIAAGALGVAAVVAGMAGAVAWDLPAGPTIVVATMAIFVAVAAVQAGARALRPPRVSA